MNLYIGWLYMLMNKLSSSWKNAYLLSFYMIFEKKY